MGQGFGQGIQGVQGVGQGPQMAAGGEDMDVKGVGSATKKKGTVKPAVKKPTPDQILDYRNIIAQESQLMLDQNHLAFANVYQVFLDSTCTNRIDTIASPD